MQQPFPPAKPHSPSKPNGLLLPPLSQLLHGKEEAVCSAPSWPQEEESEVSAPFAACCIVLVGGISLQRGGGGGTTTQPSSPSPILHYTQIRTVTHVREEKSKKSRLTQKIKLKTKSRYLMHLVQPSTPIAADCCRLLNQSVRRSRRNGTL